MMADKDITFYGDIKIDTTSAQNSIASFAKQTEDLFEKTSKKLHKTLMSGKDFDYVKHLPKYAAGLERLSGIYTTHLDRLRGQIRKPGKNASPAEVAWAQMHNAWIGRDLERLQNTKLRDIASLHRAMQRLAPYASVYSGITNLAAGIEGGKIESKVALGRYGFFQHNANSLTGVLYRLSHLFPNVFNQGVLETAESFRDRNRISGIEAREQERFKQKTAYRDRAKQRALDYLWYKGDLGELNDIYGLGVSPVARRTPQQRYVEQTEVEKNKTWIEYGMRANTIRQLLLSGSLSKAREKTLRDEYSKKMDKFIAGFSKAYPDFHEIALSLKTLKNETLGKNNNFMGVGGAVWAALGGKVAKDIFGSAGDMLQSYWGESITRNAYASRQAYLSRWTTGGKIAGSAIGGILGALLTPFLGPAAMGVGYVAGGELGKLGGTYSETKYKADIQSSTDMMARIRNQALWGGEYNTYFAKAITESGLANGEAAMGGLADKSMSMRARMMLGQVGEQEMLYMSMMPNYYAALMAGMTGPELMRIYKNDLDAIGDSSMRYLVGQTIGNPEAYTLSRSPYFGSFYSSAASTSAAYEERLRPLQRGFYAGREYAMMETLERDISEIFASARRGDKTIFGGTVEGRTAQSLKDFAQTWLKGGLLNWTLVNVIQLPDGTEIARDTKTADQLYADDLQLYTIGG